MAYSPFKDSGVFTCTQTGNTDPAYENLLLDTRLAFQKPIDKLKEILAEQYGIDFETHIVVLPESMYEQMGLPVPLTTVDIHSTRFLEGTTFYAVERSELLRKLKRWAIRPEPV